MIFQLFLKKPEAAFFTISSSIVFSYSGERFFRGNFA